MCTFLVTHDVAEVWVEDYAFVGGSRSTAEVAQCVQAVKDACILHNVPCYTIGNTVWKKDVIGKGNANKLEIKAYLVQHKMAVADLDPPDFYDALGILMAGYRRSKPITT